MVVERELNACAGSRIESRVARILIHANASPTPYPPLPSPPRPLDAPSPSVLASQVKPYAPSSAVNDNQRASDILFTIFRATLGEYGIKVADLAGGTTDSGPDVKAMGVNTLLGLHDVSWDWCTSHAATKAAEHAVGTSADIQKSKNLDARRIISLVTKTAHKVNQSPPFKQKFDEIQMDMLEEILKITKHAPQRWLGMMRTLA